MYLCTVTIPNGKQIYNGTFLGGHRKPERLPRPRMPLSFEWRSIVPCLPREERLPHAGGKWTLFEGSGELCSNRRRCGTDEFVYLRVWSDLVVGIGKKVDRSLWRIFVISLTSPVICWLVLLCCARGLSALWCVLAVSHWVFVVSHTSSVVCWLVVSFCASAGCFGVVFVISVLSSAKPQLWFLTPGKLKYAPGFPDRRYRPLWCPLTLLVEKWILRLCWLHH